MGVFSQRPEEELNEWAGLPAEPREPDAADVLDAAPAVDPFSVGLGAQYSTVVFPVAAPAPDAADAPTAGPGDDD